MERKRRRKKAKTKEIPMSSNNKVNQQEQGENKQETQDTAEEATTQRVWDDTFELPICQLNRKRRSRIIWRNTKL